MNIDEDFLRNLMIQINESKNNSIEILNAFKSPKQIKFQSGEASIILNEKTNDFTVDNYNKLDFSQVQKSDWHQILIRHNGKCSKEEIIMELNSIVEGKLFIPIAYQRGDEIDFFFMRNQIEALEMLFKKKLTILIKGFSLCMLVKIGVAEVRETQLKIINKFTEYILFCLHNAQSQATQSSTVHTLNFSRLNEHTKMSDLTVYLGNTGNLSFFLQHLNNIKKIKKDSTYRNFNFSGNNIRSLKPFCELHSVKFDTVDLSNNKIEDIFELQHLKHLKPNELYINGNECSKDFQKIREILPGLKQIDTTKISKKVTVYQTNIKGEATKIGNKQIASSAMRKPTTINSKNRSQYIKNFIQLRNENFWSMVVITHNKTYKMWDILRKIAFEICHNVIFVPCYASRQENKDTFYVFRNFDALKLIFLNDLKVRMDNTGTVFSCELHMNIAEFEPEQVNWEENIKYVIQHRVNNEKAILNNLMKESLLCKISLVMNFQILNFILDVVRKISNQVTEIHLENCQITNCEAMALLTLFPKLKVLNLRNNNIERLDGIKKSTTVSEVILDGNPICKRGTLKYISTVHEFFSHLEFLDGHRVQKGNSISTFQNFLVSMDVYNVVDEFIKYFFNVWDSFERMQLLRMYTNKSILSICVTYDYDRTFDTLPFEELLPRIQMLKSFDHNLMKLSDMSRASNKVYVGEQNIKNVLNELPRMRHDLTNCNIDVPYFDSLSARLVIIVNGVVEELTNDGTFPFLIAFTRTFTIYSKNCEFFIANDQILFRNPTTLQREAIKEHKFVAANYEDLVENCHDLMPNKQEQKTLMLIMLRELTNCKKEYCLKLLEETSWEFKRALAIFNSDLKENAIADENFCLK